MTKVNGCELVKQGYPPGNCLIAKGSAVHPACELTMRRSERGLERLIHEVHLTRPENYLSIHQSGCNLKCRYCNTWTYTHNARGSWMTPQDILDYALSYSAQVTVIEPRETITAWHATATCFCCGNCILLKKPSARCPHTITTEQVVLSAKGYGPARNIVAFTGGDLTCLPEFYEESTSLIKAETSLWVVIGTNGYGLTEQNLKKLKTAGVDGFWLDLKAFDPDTHQWLTGCGNQDILKLPSLMRDLDFVLEVYTLLIPGVVEKNELALMARAIAEVDPQIPFTILRFTPENLMAEYRSPTNHELQEAVNLCLSQGLCNVKVGHTTSME